MYETNPKTGTVLRRKAPLSNLVNSNVCYECNHGWMEELETRTDTLAERLFAGEDVRNFSLEEKSVLARWTAKTSAVLSFVTPQQRHVPTFACHSIHPTSGLEPHYRFFYAQISGSWRIEGAYFQLAYGAEIPIIGSSEVTGTRILLSLNNNFFIADFPPLLAGIRYDLRKSIAAKLWPTFTPAGSIQLGISLPASVEDLLVAVGKSIEVDLDSAHIHV